MYKLNLLSVLLIFPVSLFAASPQSNPQVYELKGGKKGQIVMLSNWAKGNQFSAFEAPSTHFTKGQQVWIWCAGRSTSNKIKGISQNANRDFQFTEILLESSSCQKTPQLMSNFDYPPQKWRKAAAAPSDIQRIQVKLKSKKKLQVTKIETEGNRIFFLVFDPEIKSTYDAGGYRLLDGKLTQISTFDGGTPLDPLIDLDGDGVPEFFFPSSDGQDAWIYQMYPKFEKLSDL